MYFLSISLVDGASAAKSCWQCGRRGGHLAGDPGTGMGMSSGNLELDLQPTLGRSKVPKHR